jgi:hypothetical protein
VLDRSHEGDQIIRFTDYPKTSYFLFCFEIAASGPRSSSSAMAKGEMDGQRIQDREYQTQHTKDQEQARRGQGRSRQAVSERPQEKEIRGLISSLLLESRITRSPYRQLGEKDERFNLAWGKHRRHDL